MLKVIPVILFAYARKEQLLRSLQCLRENEVTLLYIYADGAKGPADFLAVEATRSILRGINWCEIRLVERAQNFGLGRNVLAGVTEVASQHEMFIVWEDDLICVPGTYDWMCAALRHYQDDSRVFSVGAYTHPRVTPPGLGERPYFDLRAECWGWGGYARSWQGMGSETAEEKMAALVGRGQPPDLTGADLPVMAREETNRNLWAVRWLYHHLLHDGLCFRPPWSMVRHEGFDVAATNAQQATDWDSGPLRAAPPGPATWPEPRVHPACPALWRFALPPPPPRPSRIRTRLKQVLRKLVPASLRASIRERYHHIRWEGDFGSWAEARERSTGYDAPAIVARVAGALQEVKAGRALFERDGVAFISPAPVWPALDWVFRRAGIRHGSLRLLDFGGSLGSLYFQYRTVWDELPDVRWRVVEQPLFVETGRREFGDGRLSFFETVELAEAAGASDVLLLSGVIQCMEDPHALIESLLAKDFECIILDRTPLITRGRDRLTVQHVPATLGCASYPCWHFDRNKLLAHFLRRYICAVEYLGTDGVLGEATYRGFIFTRRDSGIHADGDAET